MTPITLLTAIRTRTLIYRFVIGEVVRVKCQERLGVPERDTKRSVQESILQTESALSLTGWKSRLHADRHESPRRSCHRCSDVG